VLLPPLPPLAPRRAWPVLKILLGCLALAMGSCVGCMVIGARASAQGAPLAAEAFRSFAQPWDAAVLVQRSSPELLATFPEEKARAYVAFVQARLGQLKRCGEIKRGQWTSNLGPQGLTVLATYFADCEFEKAPGQMTIQLIRRGENWQVNGIFLNSDVLMTDQPPASTGGSAK
jgi:hypothetical protein